MSQDQVSATALLEYIESAAEHFEKTGREFHKGTERVYSKLKNLQPGTTVRRTYVHVPGQGYAMWDLISENELADRGYKDTGAHHYHVSGSPSVMQDRITYWTSEKEAGDELWVGEPLGP